MQHDHILKKFNFGLGPAPEVHPTNSDPGLQTEIPFDMFHIYCCSACIQNFSKNIDNYHSYWEIEIFDLSEKLLNIKALMKCEDHHTKKLM